MKNWAGRKLNIDELIENEKERNREERSVIVDKIEQLPAGSLYIRKVNGRQYCYFKYREGKKIVTKYAGTIKKISEIQESIKMRQELNDYLKELDDDYQRLKKMEAIK